MITTILIIAAIIIIVSIPFSIANNNFMMKAHYRVEGRWYGENYDVWDRTWSTSPFFSIFVFMLIIFYFGNVKDGWKSDGLRG